MNFFLYYMDFEPVERFAADRHWKWWIKLFISLTPRQHSQISEAYYMGREVGEGPDRTGNYKKISMRKEEADANKCSETSTTAAEATSTTSATAKEKGLGGTASLDMW